MGIRAIRSVNAWYTQTMRPDSMPDSVWATLVSAQIYSEIRDAAEAGQLDRQQAEGDWSQSTRVDWSQKSAAFQISWQEFTF